MKGEQENWTDQHAQQWRSRAVEAVARIERLVKADQETQEPILGRLMHPEASARTHLATRRAVSALLEMVEELPSNGPTPDDMLESIYDDLNVPLTQRCLLRAVAMEAYSHARRSYRPSGVPIWDETVGNVSTRTDVFAIPAYGDPKSALLLLSQRDSLARMCSLVENSGFVGDHSVALLSVPLSVNAIHRVDVMRAIMDLEFSAETVHATGGTTASTISPPEQALAVLTRHVPQQRGAFVVAGVRVRKDNGVPDILTRLSGQDTQPDPLATPMDQMTRVVHTIWWNTAMSRIVVQANINARDVMFRPPSAPVRAQAQARALGLVHDLYARLAGRTFVRMEYESVRVKNSPASPIMMALSAFDHRGQRIAMSRPATLFEVGLGEEFQDVLQEEFVASGNAPYSIVRQELLEEYQLKSGGMSGFSEDIKSGPAGA